MNDTDEVAKAFGNLAIRMIVTGLDYLTETEAQEQERLLMRLLEEVPDESYGQARAGLVSLLAAWGGKSNG